MERALSLYRDSIAIRVKTEDTRTKVFQIRKQQQMEASAQISKSSRKTLSVVQRSNRLRNHEDKENRGTSSSCETYRRAFAECQLNQRQLETNRCKSCATPQCYSPTERVHPQDCKPEEAQTLPPIAFRSRIQGWTGEGKGGKTSKRKATDCNQNDFEVSVKEEEVGSSGCGKTESVTVTSHNWTLVTPLRQGNRRFFFSPELPEGKEDQSSDTSLWSETSTAPTVVAAPILTTTEESRSVSAKYNSKNETLVVPVGPSHEPHGLISKSLAPTSASTSGDGTVCKEGSVVGGAGSLRSLDDLSQISRESEVNRREEISTGNFNGAFHSTFNYPLHSTMNYQGTNHLDISPVPSSSVAKPSRLPTVTSPRSKNTHVITGQALSADSEPRKSGCRCAFNYQTQDPEKQTLSINKPAQVFPPKRQRKMENSPTSEVDRRNNDIALTLRQPSENVKGPVRPLRSKECANGFKSKNSLNGAPLRRQTGHVELTTSPFISESRRSRQISLLGRSRFQKLTATARQKDAAAVTVTQGKLSTSSETAFASHNNDTYKSGDLMSTGFDEVATLIDPLLSSKPEDSVTTKKCAGKMRKTTARRGINNCLPSLLAFVPCKSVKRFVGTVSTTEAGNPTGTVTLDNVAAWLCVGTKGTATDTTIPTSPRSPQTSEGDVFPSSDNDSNSRNSAGGFKTEEDVARFSASGNRKKSCALTSGRQQRQNNIGWKKQRNEMRRRLRRAKPISRTNIRQKVCRQEEKQSTHSDDTVCIRTLGFL